MLSLTPPTEEQKKLRLFEQKVDILLRIINSAADTSSVKEIAETILLTELVEFFDFKCDCEQEEEVDQDLLDEYDEFLDEEGL